MVMVGSNYRRGGSIAALKEAFEIFCNKTVAGSSSAELLATFCDNILKKGGSEKLTDEAIEETLEKVVKQLAYISDNDLFAEFYRKKLARRLLFDRSANDDHEKCILTKLKQQCGGQFTSKMEGTVVDLTLARDNQMKFEEYLREQPHGIGLQERIPRDKYVVLTLLDGKNLDSSYDKNVPFSFTLGWMQLWRTNRELSNKHLWVWSLLDCPP